MFVDQQ